MAGSNRASSLVVTSQQTRFYLALEDHAAKELDIKTLNISIAAATQSSQSKKGKTKASKADAVEILVDAELRLRAGVHYALIGRNGAGKSTILRALADKLIPGIPIKMRIAILQQMEDGDSATGNGNPENPALEYVINSDPYRNAVVRKVKALVQAFDSGEALAPVRIWRSLEHERMEFELSEARKMAQLRSGARGKDAREFLVAFEDKVKDHEKMLIESSDEIKPEQVERETTLCADLLTGLQVELDAMPENEVTAQARQVLTGLGFTEAHLNTQFKSLSGGWQMRCRLAGALIQVSDILILDEPTNYLDLLGILWLQRYLESLKDSSPDRILLLVSHDRDVLNAVAADTIILQDKKLVYFNGSVSSYDKSIRHEILYKSRMQDAQDKQRAHMEKTIANNMKIGKQTGDDGKIKQAKSRQKKLEERTGLEVSSKGTRFKLNRDLPGYHLTNRAAIEVPEKERTVTMAFPEAPELRFPGSLVSLENASFSYSKKSSPIFEGANLVVQHGDRIGILGLNGAGKSTLIKVLVGQLKPTKGVFATHSRVKIAHYSQHAVDELKTLEFETPQSDTPYTPCALAALQRKAEELGQEVSEQDARGLLGSMGLPGRIVTDIPIHKLSGGQLVRLELCRLLIGRPHMLILDEPTTHLDLPTVKALTRALIKWDGTVIIVSHDRYLIRCVVEGDEIDERDSDEESDEDQDSRENRAVIPGSRQLVYELRAGKMVQISSVTAWEAKLERRLKKLGF